MKGGDTVLILSAGLPNITGGMADNPTARGWNDVNVPTGAFATNERVPNAFDAKGIYGYKISFDASLSNPIYGATDTVQPPAIQLIPQIKY